MNLLSDKIEFTPYEVHTLQCANELITDLEEAGPIRQRIEAILEERVARECSAVYNLQKLYHRFGDQALCHALNTVSSHRYATVHLAEMLFELDTLTPTAEEYF